MLKPSLTVVLPVHNGEARLRGCVGEVLELASELTSDFQVLIIDDGSTDDTFAAAEELAARYPQVTVRRHRQQRGLGPTLEAVRRRVRSDVVIFHDGVSPIDADQIRQLWRHQSLVADRPQHSENVGMSSLADATATHAALALAHERVLGFQLLTPQPIQGPDELSEWAISPAERTDASHHRQGSGLGRIPPLPRPKFLSALAEFAFGE